jgi:hypothetical protein
MVYISSWQDYQEAAEALYTKSPNDVRFLPTPPSRVLIFDFFLLPTDPLLRKMEII